MKIMLFVHALGAGGAERVTTTLAAHWVESGHDVTVVTTADSKGDFYPLDPRVYRISLDLADESRSIFNALVNNARRTFAMRKIMQEEGPNVAIGIAVKINVLLAFAGIKLRTATIGTEHSYPARDDHGMIWNNLRKRSYGLLDLVIALTEKSADWLQAETKAKKVAVIPNPVSLPLPRVEPIILPSDLLNNNDNVKILLAVGRLVRTKRFDRLIDAFAEIIPSHPDWRLVILGEGPLRGVLKAQIIQREAEDNILLAGLTGNLEDWFMEAELLASTSELEGLSLVLIEALSYGTPVIAVDCDTGPSDIVQSEINGLLIEQDDPVMLRDALARCMSDNVLRSKFAENAPETIKKFSLGAVGEKWNRTFAQVVK